jgi:phage gp46-like protein
MLKLIQTDWEKFDLAFDATVPRDAEIAFSTLVYAVLFTDAEANEAYVPDRYQRRGWWFDAEMGSLIWILRQQPLSMQTRLAVLDNVTNALSSRPELANVIVTDITPPRIVSSMSIAIAALYNDVPKRIELLALSTLS